MSAGRTGRTTRSPLAALLAALRISRRDALRSKGRSALIIAMIGLPVLVVTAFLTLAETADIDPREGLTAALGTADAHIRTAPARAPLRQDLVGRAWSSPGGDFEAPPPPPWTETEVAGLLETGTRLLPANEGTVEFRGPDGYDQADALETDLRDPLTAGMFRLLEGRFPASSQEVVVTAALRGQGLRRGAALAVTRQDRPVRIVGVVEHPHRIDWPQIVGFPGVLLLDRRDGSGTGWLADTPGPVVWETVRKLNAAGLLVHSRAAVQNPPAPEQLGLPSGRRLESVVAIGLTGTMIVLEVVLLAGPAFAVGLRRRRRELALLAAQGGSPGQLRTVVLADGLVLGGTAALLGLVLGVGGASLAALLEAGRLIGRAGPLDVPWGWVVGIAVLGTVSGLAAAVAPAVQAARQDPAAVLGGRRNRARERAGRPVLGTVLLVAGIAAAVFAVRFDAIWVLAAALLSQLGLIALTPRLVRAAAGLAGRLPLPFRLAARDASRHRIRTASAVAAVMTATAAFTAAGVAVSSDFAENRDSFQAFVPAGTLVVEGRDLDDAAWAKVREAVRERLPDAPLIEAAEVRDEAGRGMGIEVVPPSDSRRVFRGAELPVGDGRLLHLVQGRPDPVAGAAFAAGAAVVFDPGLLRDGRLTLELWPHGEGESRRVTVPAVAARAVNPEHAVVVLPVSALRAAGLQTAPRRLYVPPDGHRLGTEEEIRFRRDLAAVSAGKAGSYLELGFDGGYLAPQLWILLGAALVLVLGGTFVATGLAAADLRPDLATMAAVGAPPGIRRLVIAGQAGFIAGLGVLVGALAGVVTGIGVAWPMTTRTHDLAYLMETHGGMRPFPQGPPTVELPWLFLAAVVVGLPVLAAAVAALFARTKVTLTRRIA
ncbi:FtsX-like permease family protein [Planomonospora sp. ID82291]|uniref:FtsX-like permease family protein n=1 Tax=Planomonospora sp. ID82291 TaxID=2738136 RepID=UPI0018C3B568|nr:FtsX-like permease family protein [Planomonospora sp. ID82291]MBG0815373.1 FtsX-like permease family protein [Planomonospora sp. ID82291]